jgi:type III restriction enzyme
LNLIGEIKDLRGEDTKDKASPIEAYWVPGVNNLGGFGRWAFSEFTSVFEIESDFKVLIETSLTISEANQPDDA